MSISNSPQLPILTQLISDVNDLKHGYEVTEDTLLSNENDRIANEEIRKENEVQRGNKFNELEQKINDDFNNLSSIIDNKIDEVDVVVNDIQADYDTLKGGLLADDKVVYFQNELNTVNASLEYNTNMINHVNNFENKVIQIAHRGYSVVAPENTLASFEMACLNGFDAVEIDAIFTSDNEIVIMHDDTIDRTTDGTGRVDEMTLTQLKSFNIDFGNELGMYDTQKIPTLDECLELFSKYKKTPCIEIKGLNTVERFNIFMNKLKKYGFSTQKNVIVIGGYDTLLQFKNTGVQLGIVCTNVTNDIVNQAYELNAFVDFGGFEQDTNVLNYAREKKVMLGSWTPANSWTNYQKAISLGVKFFTTDKPLIVDKATEININNKDILTKIQSRSGITITDDINASGDYLVTFNNRGNFELKKNTSALNYLMFFITNLNKGDIVELSCDYKVKNSELINFGAGFLSSDGINGLYKVINSEMVTKTYTEQFVGWNSFKINTMYTGKDYDSKTLRLHFGVFDGLGDVEVKNLKINLSNNNAKIYGLSTTNTVSYTETVSTVITKTADGWTENNNLGNTITVVDANTLRLDFKTPFPSTTGVNYTGIVTVDYDHLYHCRINFASRTSIAFRFFSSTNANMTLDTVGIGTKVFITWFGANKTIII